jgi:hypothetical protein
MTKLIGHISIPKPTIAELLGKDFRQGEPEAAPPIVDVVSSNE